MDKVIRYTPEFLKNNDISDKIFQVEKSEIDLLDSEIMRIFKNNFISELDVKGIEKYEELLDLIPVNSDIEVRRNSILDRMTYRPPITRLKFLNILFGIWGDGNYSFEIKYDEYKVIVDIYATNPIIYWQFQTQVRNLVPANMIVIFSLQYTHLYLKRNYTYGEMRSAGLTYGELSRYSNQGE